MAIKLIRKCPRSTQRIKKARLVEKYFRFVASYSILLCLIFNPTVLFFSSRPEKKRVKEKMDGIKSRGVEYFFFVRVRPLAARNMADSMILCIRNSFFGNKHQTEHVPTTDISEWKGKKSFLITSRCILKVPVIKSMLSIDCKIRKGSDSKACESFTRALGQGCNWALNRSRKCMDNSGRSEINN